MFSCSLWGAGDAFWPMTRAALGPNGISMPFTISDDSVVAAFGNNVFENDVLGFAGIAFENDGFFGMTDTENPQNAGPLSATFVFDVTGAAALGVSMEIVGMGDFEAADVFTVEAAIDLGPFVTIFASSVDEAGNQNYFMDNPLNNPVNLFDPMSINGTTLTDNYKFFSAGLGGTGSELTIRVQWT